MNHRTASAEGRFRLTFDGSMTRAFARELEDRIISAMRRHPHLEVDLSGVREIDPSGIQLIRLLQTVGGKAVDFVAASAIVEHAIHGLLPSPCNAHLGAPH